MSTQFPYRVAACDLDHTLLNGGDISQKNRDAVQLLKERQVVVVLSTGRNFHHALPYHRRLGLTSPIVSSDGALVSIPGSEGRILSETPLAPSASSAIITEAAASKITCLNFFRHGVYLTSRHDWSDAMERHREIGRHFRRSSTDVMIKRAVYKTLLFSQHPDKLDALAELVLERFGDVLDLIRNNPYVVEFIGKGVSKVSGLEVVAAHLGLDSSAVVAFGDGANDVSTFRWAGLSVCMSHGHPFAQAAATIVAPPSDPSINFATAVASVLAHVRSK